MSNVAVRGALLVVFNVLISFLLTFFLNISDTNTDNTSSVIPVLRNKIRKSRTELSDCTKERLRYDISDRDLTFIEKGQPIHYLCSQRSVCLRLQHDAVLSFNQGLHLVFGIFIRAAERRSHCKGSRGISEEEST